MPHSALNLEERSDGGQANPAGRRENRLDGNTAFTR